MERSPLSSGVEAVPVLKLPPEWFNPSMNALADGSDSRAEVVRRLVLTFHRPKDEKLVVRAFVVPTMTRLHFIRARLGQLPLAPNGSLWRSLPDQARDLYTGLCLRDLVAHRLNLDPRFADPDFMRQAASNLGPRAKDRCAGLVRLLRRFPAPSPQISTDLVELDVRNSMGVATVMEDLTHAVRPYLEEASGGRQVVDLDAIRIHSMRSLLSRGTAVSSFIIDKVILAVMREGDLFLPFGAATNQLEALVIGRRPFTSVRPRVAT